jgi:hypothetical protein
MAKIPLPDTAEHWIKRAERVRIQAEQADDPLSQEMLLRIAEDFERLAEHEFTRQQARKLTEAGVISRLSAPAV